MKSNLTDKTIRSEKSFAQIYVAKTFILIRERKNERKNEKNN